MVTMSLSKKAASPTSSPRKPIRILGARSSSFGRATKALGRPKTITRALSDGAVPAPAAVTPVPTAAAATAVEPSLDLSPSSGSVASVLSPHCNPNPNTSHSSAPVLSALSPIPPKNLNSMSESEADSDHEGMSRSVRNSPAIRGRRNAMSTGTRSRSSSFRETQPFGEGLVATYKAHLDAQNATYEGGMAEVETPPIGNAPSPIVVESSSLAMCQPFVPQYETQPPQMIHTNSTPLMCHVAHPGSSYTPPAPPALDSPPTPGSLVHMVDAYTGQLFAVDSCTGQLYTAHAAPPPPLAMAESYAPNPPTAVHQTQVVGPQPMMMTHAPNTIPGVSTGMTAPPAAAPMMINHSATQPVLTSTVAHTPALTHASLPPTATVSPFVKPGTPMQVSPPALKLTPMIDAGSPVRQLPQPMEMPVQTSLSRGLTAAASKWTQPSTAGVVVPPQVMSIAHPTQTTPYTVPAPMKSSTSSTPTTMYKTTFAAGMVGTAPASVLPNGLQNTLQLLGTHSGSDGSIECFDLLNTSNPVCNEIIGCVARFTDYSTKELVHINYDPRTVDKEDIRDEGLFLIKLRVLHETTEHVIAFPSDDSRKPCLHDLERLYDLRTHAVVGKVEVGPDGKTVLVDKYQIPPCDAHMPQYASAPYERTMKFELVLQNVNPCLKIKDIKHIFNQIAAVKHVQMPMDRTSDEWDEFQHWKKAGSTKTGELPKRVPNTSTVFLTMKTFLGALQVLTVCNDPRFADEFGGIRASWSYYSGADRPAAKCRYSRQGRGRGKRTDQNAQPALNGTRPSY